MKKLLFAVPLVLLLAAACNKAPTVSTTVPAANSTSQTTPTATPTPSTSQTTPTATSTPTTTVSPVNNNLVIKEWGVEFQKPAGMSDLEYVIATNSGSDGAAYFTTQQLVDLDKSTGGKYCVADQDPIGILERVQNFDAQQQSGHYIPVNVKVGDWYYFIETPQATCSDNKQVQALASKEILGGAVLQTLQAVSNVNP
jgi:hypothetical protein